MAGSIFATRAARPRWSSTRSATRSTGQGRRAPRRPASHRCRGASDDTLDAAPAGRHGRVACRRSQRRPRSGTGPRSGGERLHAALRPRRTTRSSAFASGHPPSGGAREGRDAAATPQPERRRLPSGAPPTRPRDRRAVQAAPSPPTRATSRPPRRLRLAGEEFTRELANGASNARSSLLIERFRGWSFGTASRPERASCESPSRASHRGDIPDEVAIDEAVEAAKELGADAPRFVNGSSAPFTAKGRRR